MNALKKITVWLVAAGVMFGAAAVWNPPRARTFAATVLNVFVANTSANPVPTSEVSAQVVLLLDQHLVAAPGQTVSTGPVNVSMFKEIRVWQAREGRDTSYALVTRLLDPTGSIGEEVLLDDINASKTGLGTNAYDIVWPKIDVLLTPGPTTPFQTFVHVQVYGRTK